MRIVRFTLFNINLIVEGQMRPNAHAQFTGLPDTIVPK